VSTINHLFASNHETCRLRIFFVTTPPNCTNRALDHETALSAVRNLNNVDVGGRPLRIDLADSDPFLEGKTTVRGELVDGGFADPVEPRHRGAGGGRGHEGDFLSQLPPGVHVPKGTNVLDYITTTLAKMPPSQLMEVLAQMKAGFVVLLNTRFLTMVLLSIGVHHYSPRTSSTAPCKAPTVIIRTLPRSLVEQHR
jgi:hypothetical protein